MAHRCWAVDDIVRVIIEILVSEARGSAVALATCSKSLEEPALREVWRSLTSLTPLVKCFPSEVWKIKEQKLVFKRAPLEAEWTRFQKRYASKVQYLTLFARHMDACPSTALHLLQLYSSDRPLLPNLVSLRWFSDEKYLPFISSFISPSLTSIGINVPQSASLMLPPILKRLSALSPNIREIKLYGGGGDGLNHDSSTEEATSQLLLHHHYIHKFLVDSPISASALRHVIQLPLLEEVRLVNPIQLPDPLPMLVFPSLQRLEVKCNGDDTWMKLVPAIKNPVLTTINVKVPGSDIERFMETFEQTMTGCGMHERLQDFTLESPDNSITPQIIARNLSFKNLTSLSLMVSSGCFDDCQTSDLTDGDIDLLTRTMPCLECLNIGSSPCNVPSQMTFKSLYNISSRCTRLTDLQIHFNPTLFVTNIGKKFESWDVALGLSDLKTHSSSDLCHITTICVGDMSLPTQSNASYILALGLLGVFPHLEEIEYDDGDWIAVEFLMGVCRRMSCSAFGMK